MDLKTASAKIVSFFLLLSSLYQTLLSVNAIFFIYPNLIVNHQNQYRIEEGLIEKAIILYATMLTGGLYGLSLLLKPSDKLKFVHIFSGLIIFFVSVFFVSRTPFTTDPVQNLLINLLN